MNKRVVRESHTIGKMVTIYCKAKHRSGSELCCDCNNMLEYALQRLQYCSFGEDKPVCSKCSVHCYSKNMREKIIAVMRYSGVHMLYKHPISALLHFIDSYRCTLRK